jgi:uncharacterized lipoprotein YmbA
MKIPRWIARPTALAIGSVMLAGCHSLPPLHYYVLDAVTPAAAPVAPGFSNLLHIRHLSVPHEMDHLGLTHHMGPTQLAISDTDQWSAPLTDLIQGTLTRDLGARLGFDHVVAPDALPAGATNGVAALDLDFVTLAADDACAIEAQVNWTLSVPGSVPRHGTVHLVAPASSCPAGLPASLSAALGDLAEQLAQQLRTP